MHTALVDRVMLESDMRRGIEDREFWVAYQPIVDLTTREVTGMEALARWRHPLKGLIPPVEFIPVAEETGLIVPIGEWVFREVCRQLHEWGGSAVRVSVNVSARQFRQPDLVDFIARCLKESSLRPEALAVEITESALIDDPDNAAATLSRIKDMGLTISLDDFGTGYSSLSYLKRFPINCLKIDRAFVRDIATDPTTAIVTAIITMAGLELDVVAGVERNRSTSCARGLAAQGYFFSKPLPADSQGSWPRRARCFLRQRSFPRKAG
jgi:EAL domain-containing protein (putative c-di-GMP-specific phosphodiesterase class I)